MMKYLLLMSLGSTIFFWADQRQKGVEIRNDTAKEWSGIGAQFVATGIDSETLLVVLPDEDPVLCDAYVDSIAADKNTRWLVKSRGFTTLKCMDRVLVLR
jgi:hypothetical protein